MPAMHFALAGRRVFAGTGGRDHEPGLPTVVLIHGAGMDHSVFALQARALAHHGRNVLALDLPGHGRSEGPTLDSVAAIADWVLRAAASCGVERLRLAGHSMGALVALEAASRGGARIEARSRCSASRRRCASIPISWRRRAPEAIARSS
jgi:pimeloyl-ACP methyl ester carboxylesterase